MICILAGVISVVFILLFWFLLPVSSVSGAGSQTIKIIPRNLQFKEAVKSYEPYGIVVDSEKAARQIRTLSAGNRKIYTSFGSNGVCKQHLHLIMAQNGYKWIQQDKLNNKKLDYLCVELNPQTHEYDSESFKIKARVKNLINEKTFRMLFSKEILGTTLVDSGIVPQAYCLENLPESPGVVIVKPADKTGHLGHGIKIYTNPTRRQISADFTKHAKISISQYIDNPLLYHERKFHFRVLMAVSKSWIKYAHIFVIVLAENSYRHADYSDSKIHDSHAKSTPWYKTFPEGFAPETHKPILKGVNKIMTCIANKIKHVMTYPQADFSYQIAGIDIMFDDNLQPWIIEVNNTSGFALSYPEFESFEKAFFTWEFYNCISQKDVKDVKNVWKHMIIFEKLQLVFDLSSSNIQDLHRVFGKLYNFRIHKTFCFVAKTPADEEFARFNNWYSNDKIYWLCDLQ